MSESSLTIGYPELLQEVGEFLGFDRDTSQWSAEQTAQVDRYVQSGYRQFLYPPAFDGIEAGYEWSFLKPAGSVATVADAGEVDLPYDFDQLIGDLTYDPGYHCASVMQVSQGRILAWRQNSSATGRPCYAAVRYKESDGSAGQRQELMLYPTPDAAYTLNFRYNAFTGKLSTALPYPLGGMRYAEVLIESCLAVAEQRADDERGLHWESFLRLLADATARDKKNSARYFGQMGGGDLSKSPAYPYRTPGENYPITYKGETW